LNKERRKSEKFLADGRENAQKTQIKKALRLLRLFAAMNQKSMWWGKRTREP
jgi:hypothetical protein